MKAVQGLARFAGHDPMEREMGIGTGKPCGNLAKALIYSRTTLNRWQRYRAAAKSSPPSAAKGGFPYNLMSVAECDPHRLKCDHTVRPCDYGCDDDA